MQKIAIYGKGGIGWKLYHDYTTYYKEKHSRLGGARMARR